MRTASENGILRHLRPKKHRTYLLDANENVQSKQSDTAPAELRVILKRCDEHDLVKEHDLIEEHDLINELSAISLDPEKSGLDSSVEFVCEQEASSEAKHIVKLNQKVSKLEYEKRKLELHIRALQRHVAKNQDKVSPVEDENVVNAGSVTNFDEYLGI